MKILLTHQNAPGQYLHLLKHFAKRGDQVVFITQRAGLKLPGVRIINYRPHRAASAQTHHYLRSTEEAIINGQEVVRIALRLKRNGFIPDLMLGHSGWGEILFLKDVFPSTPLLGYFEYFYHLRGADIGFAPDDSASTDTAAKIRARNAINLLSLTAADLGHTPTYWQHSLHPPVYHPMLTVAHEGIDTHVLKPDPSAYLPIPGADITVSRHDEILTYVGRNLEPHRGFPSLMRSLPEILSRRPKARVLIVGADGTSYGPPPASCGSWKQLMINELKDGVDWSRVHFLGRIPYRQFVSLLQVSRVHVYLTYPFVLSWSMLEAMAAGCVVIGSKTPPVEEVIRNGDNGLLVDFFSPKEIADLAVAALRAPGEFSEISAAARCTAVEQYDLHSVCLPRQIELIARATGGNP